MEHPEWDFDAWRKWFLWIVEEEIFKAHGVSIRSFRNGGENNTFILRAFGPPDFNPSKDRKKYSRFLSGFRKLCLEIGFDPCKERDYNGFTIDGEGKNWTPNFGEVGAGFAKNCYKFYDRQVREAARDIDDSKKWKEFLKKPNRRIRLPIAICESILFFLLERKGNVNELQRLRKYFSKGKFSKDLRELSLAFASQIEKFNKEEEAERRRLAKLVRGTKKEKEIMEGDSEKIVADFGLPVFISISGLARHRGATDYKMWASHWRHDLTRVLLSEKEERIVKAMVSEAQKEELLMKVVRAGRAAIRTGKKRLILG